ncbi:MAG: hypothetical protein GH155_01230 [Spirochaeta sp.]|nr:hypothetical protein [Spirochaeta sp.]
MEPAIYLYDLQSIIPNTRLPVIEYKPGDPVETIKSLHFRVSQLKS